MPQPPNDDRDLAQSQPPAKPTAATGNDGFLQELKQELSLRKNISIIWKYDDTNQFFVELTDRKNVTSQSIFVFIRLKLMQYGLYKLYDETSILSEVYYRTLKKIVNGGSITNPEAWVKSVAFRYIKEISRKHSHDISYDESTFDHLYYHVESIPDTLSDELLKVRQALQELPSDDAKLLELRIVSKLSWSDVQAVWATEGYGNLSLTALRKKGSRALAQLRSVYHKL